MPPESASDPILGSTFGTVLLAVIVIVVVGGVIWVCIASMLGGPEEYDPAEYDPDEHDQEESDELTHVEYTLRITTRNPEIDVEELDEVIRSAVGQLSGDMDPERWHGLDIQAEGAVAGQLTVQSDDPDENLTEILASGVSR